MDLQTSKIRVAQTKKMTALTDELLGYDSVNTTLKPWNTSTLSAVIKTDLLEESRKEYLHHVAMRFNRYYPPIIVIVGYIGNTLSLACMLQVRHYLH